MFGPPHGVINPGQVVANFGVDLWITLETALGPVTEEPNQGPAAIVLVPGYLFGNRIKIFVDLDSNVNLIDNTRSQLSCYFSTKTVSSKIH